MEKWQYDLKVCPDCQTRQSRKKKAGERCDNEDCESSVYATKKGTLYWWNENWG